MFNYDMVASQVHGLMQCFEDAGIDTAWLVRYVEADKGDYADRAFGSLIPGPERKDVWKRCVLALFMGAALPGGDHPPTQKEVEGQLSIAEYVHGAVFVRGGGSTADVVQALSGFKKEVSGLTEALNAWHRYLVGPYYEEHAMHGRGGRYVRNAVGVTLKVSGLDQPKLKRKLAAHLLQGLEAEFVCHLTLLGEAYGFVPMSNQYDGLVTEGEIPKEAVEEAKGQSQLRYAELALKPFV